MGIGQLRGFRCHRHIAEQSNIGREPECVTINSSDDRLFDIEHVLDHPPPISHHDPSPATTLALSGLVATRNVASYGERFTRTGQQDRINVAILGQVQPDLLELVVQGGINGVELLGTVKGHCGYPLSDLNLEKFVRAVVNHRFTASFCSSTNIGEVDVSSSSHFPFSSICSI